MSQAPPKPLEVLIVEDEVGDIMLMKQALTKESVPISIHVAVDGKQAAQMLTESYFTPDVIILDLNIPKLSGLGFLEGYGLDTPVVVFTSSSNKHDQQRAMELGAKDYVVKPTDLDEYRTAVGQMVHRWAKAA